MTFPLDLSFSFRRLRGVGRRQGKNAQEKKNW
jgi:hypothetical protein